MHQTAELILLSLCFWFVFITPKEFKLELCLVWGQGIILYVDSCNVPDPLSARRKPSRVKVLREESVATSKVVGSAVLLLSKLMILRRKVSSNCSTGSTVVGVESTTNNNSPPSSRLSPFPSFCVECRCSILATVFSCCWTPRRLLFSP